MNVRALEAAEGAGARGAGAAEGAGARTAGAPEGAAARGVTNGTRPSIDQTATVYSTNIEEHVIRFLYAELPDRSS